MLPGMGAYRMKNWRQLFRPACRVTEVTEVTEVTNIECDESTTAGAWRRSLVEGFGIGNP